MSSNIEEKKKILRKTILEEYAKVEMDTQYSSLWTAKYGKSKWIWPLRILTSIIASIPLILEIINTDARWLKILCLVIVLLLSAFGPEWKLAILQLRNKCGNDLIDLNSPLTQYEYKLENLHNRLLVCSSNIDTLTNEFEALRTEYLPKLNEHDKLTGIIDVDLENQAREKTSQIIELKGLVIYE